MNSTWGNAPFSIKVTAISPSGEFLCVCGYPNIRLSAHEDRFTSMPEVEKFYVAQVTTRHPLRTIDMAPFETGVRYQKLTGRVIYTTRSNNRIANFYFGDQDLGHLWLDAELVSAISLGQQVEMIERIEASLTQLKTPPPLMSVATAPAPVFHSSVPPSFQQPPPTLPTPTLTPNDMLKDPMFIKALSNQLKAIEPDPVPVTPPPTQYLPPLVSF